MGLMQEPFYERFSLTVGIKTKMLSKVQMCRTHNLNYPITIAVFSELWYGFHRHSLVHQLLHFSSCWICHSDSCLRVSAALQYHVVLRLTV